MSTQIPLSISAHLLREEASKRGIICQTFADEHLILMSKNGKSWYTSGSRTSFQSSVGRSIAVEKNITKMVLQAFSIPTAKYVYVRLPKDLDQIHALQLPLVMKPTDGHQGAGVIVGIQSYEEANVQFKAQQKAVLFEELLEGIEYRVLCIDYQVFAIAYRKPAFVTGDGVQTVTALIAEKNADPLRKEGHYSPLTKIAVDEIVIENLSQQGYTLESIPAAGVEVFLRKTANLSTGGEATDVTDSVCAENKILFEQIARCCDLNTIGIDVMCSSLETPIVNQPKAGIIEINASPGLRMHHFPSHGTPRNAAGAILDMIERNI